MSLNRRFHYSPGQGCEDLHKHTTLAKKQELKNQDVTVPRRRLTVTRRHKKNWQKVKCLSLLTHSRAQAFDLWYPDRNCGRRGLAAQAAGCFPDPRIW